MTSEDEKRFGEKLLLYEKVEDMHIRLIEHAQDQYFAAKRKALSVIEESMREHVEEWGPNPPMKFIQATEEAERAWAHLKALKKVLR